MQIKSPSGPIQLAVEAGKCNAITVLVRVVERHAPSGAGEWPTKAHDVRHGALLHHDLHDFGMLAKLKVFFCFVGAFKFINQYHDDDDDDNDGTRSVLLSNRNSMNEKNVPCQAFTSHLSQIKIERDVTDSHSCLDSLSD